MAPAVRALSGGERQRLFVALALVGRPRLVFLDELTQNLDPVGRRHTWDVVRRVRDAGTTVVLVTHDVEEAERLCDRIVVLDRGRVVADGTPASIVADLGGRPRRASPTPTLDVRPSATCPASNGVDRHGAEVRVAGTGPVLAHVGAHLVAVGRPPRPAGRAARRSRTASSPSPRPAEPKATSHELDHHRRRAARRPRRQRSARAVRSRTLRPAFVSSPSSCGCSLREPMVAVGLIGFPLATVLVLAGVFGQGPDPEFGGVAPSDHYLAGYIGVVLAALGLITIPVHLATQRELGVLRRFRASGVSAGVLVASEIALGVVLGTVAVAVVLAGGAAVYGLQMPVDPLGVVGWYVAGLVCFIAIGVALGSLVPTGSLGDRPRQPRLRADVPARRRRPAASGHDLDHADDLRRPAAQPRRRRPAPGLARHDRRPPRPLVAGARGLVATLLAVARARRRAD